MANEVPELWVKAEHTEWQLGHFHKKRNLFWMDIDERFGTIIRVLPSLSGTDAWHHGRGYIGNNRSAQMHIYGEKSGYKGHFQININELKLN